MRLSPVLPPDDRSARGRSVPQRRGPSEPRVSQRLPERPRYNGPASDPVRAVAVAHERCNAVGTVELACGPQGLWVRFVRISAFTDGYVPYPSISGHAITVPYEQVVRVATDVEGLVHLTFDPSCTPFHRLVLAGLARETTFDHHFSWLLRARFEHGVMLTSIALWLPMAAALKALVPSLSELLVLAIAGTVSLLLNGMRRNIASRLVLFGARAERARSELVADLSLRLAPGRVQDLAASSAVEAADVPGTARVTDREVAEATGLGPLFATAGIVAAVALIAILVGRTLWLQPREVEAPLAGEPAALAHASSSALAGAPAGSIAAEPPRAAPVLPPCSCERNASSLWADGVPRLSILSTARPGKTSARKPSVYPEIAVVNNANEELKSVMLTVDFSLSAREGRPARHTGEQGLLYDGVLGPGQAVKWRIKGRGDDFSVTSSIAGSVGEDGVEPAPADTFQKLLSARTPSVRLHGAKMLAWLGDPHAREAIEALEKEHREDMAPTLAKLADAVRPVRVCAPKLSQGPTPTSVRLEACVFNASTEQHDRPALVVRTWQGEVAQETRWIVEASLPAGTGVRTSGTAEVGEGGLETAAQSLQLLAEP